MVLLVIIGCFVLGVWLLRMLSSGFATARVYRPANEDFRHSGRLLTTGLLVGCGVALFAFFFWLSSTNETKLGRSITGASMAVGDLMDGGKELVYGKESTPSPKVNNSVVRADGIVDYDPVRVEKYLKVLNDRYGFFVDSLDAVYGSPFSKAEYFCAIVSAHGAGQSKVKAAMVAEFIYQAHKDKGVPWGQFLVGTMYSERQKDYFLHAYNVTDWIDAQNLQRNDPLKRVKPDGYIEQ